MEPDADPGREKEDDAPADAAEPAPAPDVAAEAEASLVHAAPRRPRRRRTWPVLVAILAVVAAVLLLVPTTTIAKPALIAPINQDGTVSMLAVTVERVPWFTQLLCVNDDTCYIPNVGGDAEGFPTDMPESIVAARIAAQALTPEPVDEQQLPPNTQGPSAGLAFGLAGYLDATGSTLGGRIAATGTLDPYGSVGPVSGVAAKAAIAQADGIDLLLVPERNTPLTGPFTGTVVEVATLQDAIAAACALPGSTCVPPTLETTKGASAEALEQGVRLSGGERQRVAIARALLREPLLLVLDEATSSLDDATESQVLEMMTSLVPSVTVLVIEHRQSTIDIDAAHHVVRLEGGRRVDV